MLQVAKYFFEMPDLRGSVWSIPTKPREIQNVSMFQNVFSASTPETRYRDL